MRLIIDLEIDSTPVTALSLSLSLLQLRYVVRI